ncbi:MAG: UDP-N-acetylmuramoyl-L-alanyl-D-glutamate--2,6-diaminopimelate ligase [Clostridia bacterium]|nr:UDP-N-acetylmuramoyl-L-alanyl-D-glutamate--2,6-diaminopimelate ligase [Clostridia bacterium]MBQ9786332.1 UDP-N-acetylmuramoyl-L-alanyl-D-glutamate--2,6-diaminopimelate ligase [Clostridia bacterium]
MKIEKIVGNEKIERIIGDFTEIDIKNLCCDTHKIEKDSLYFCLKGSSVDGHDFAENAKKLGACALVVERVLDVDLPQIVVKNARYAMAVMAGNFYDNPRNKLNLIGITGTNGKTTTTYMIQSILQNAGHKVGVIGTIGVVIEDITLPAQLTTPDPIELHKLFAQMVEYGIDSVVMEVSAHAIALDKMAGVVCDVGVLTNVTQDHIDFFKSFKNYSQTKEKFITSQFCKYGVVNIDDKIGKKIVLNNEKNNTNLKIFSFGLNNPCDVFAVKPEYSLSGTNYCLNLFDELYTIKTKLIGQFNLLNALGAATACKILGINDRAIIQGLKDMDFVPGRFNVIDLGNNKSAILDYAHTPDGLMNILSATRKVTSGKIISVFGCGGNRDALKRPIMGKISGELADFTIITSDNPRFEEPMKIISHIEDGIKQVSQNYLCVEDRKQAIDYALNMLNENDVVVISGKGAEEYIDKNGIKYPYSDKQTILEINKINNKENQGAF